MSARRVVAPQWVIECQYVDCDEQSQSSWCEHFARKGAQADGWQVRPSRGRGSRSAPEYCPQHRADGGAR